MVVVVLILSMQYPSRASATYGTLQQHAKYFAQSPSPAARLYNNLGEKVERKGLLHLPKRLLVSGSVDGVEAQHVAADWVRTGQRLDQTGGASVRVESRQMLGRCKMRIEAARGQRARQCGRAGLIDDKRIGCGDYLDRPISAFADALKKIKIPCRR